MNPEYFDRMYAESPDPWGFTTRWYERRKVALTLASLSQERYESCFEPGCSIGVLTEQLARRCDHVIATDIADSALASADSRLTTGGVTNVELRQWALGEQWPEETFDLIVLSEVGYYIAPVDAAQVVANAVGHLGSAGTLLSAHWRRPVAEYPSDGDGFHAVLDRSPGIDRLSRYVDEDVVIEVFVAGEAQSVATREGLT